MEGGGPEEVPAAGVPAAEDGDVRVDWVLTRVAKELNVDINVARSALNDEKSSALLDAFFDGGKELYEP